jgi:hypothetical protein
MAVIEILAYSSNDMEAFRRFFIDGRPDGQGGFETDEQGRMKLGVLRWLHGREVREAHFSSTPIGHPMKLFMALVDRPEDREVPWMGVIPGIEGVIRIDGLIGQTSDFPPISSLLAAVVPDDDLNERFRTGRANVQTVLTRLNEEPGTLSIGRDEVLGALRRGSNAKEVFAEIQSTFGISL